MDDIVMPWGIAGCGVGKFTQTITHSIPINLFIKLGLNIFSVPLLVGIMFVSIVFFSKHSQVSEGSRKA